MENWHKASGKAQVKVTLNGVEATADVIVSLAEVVNSRKKARLRCGCQMSLAK